MFAQKLLIYCSHWTRARSNTRRLAKMKKRRRHTSGIGTKRQTWSGMPPRSALSNAHPGPFWRTGVATNVFPRIVRVSMTKIISLHITMTMKVQPSTRPTVDWASAYCAAQRAAAKSSTNWKANSAVHQWSFMIRHAPMITPTPPAGSCCSENGFTEWTFHCKNVRQPWLRSALALELPGSGSKRMETKNSKFFSGERSNRFGSKCF